jgi:hypothetical protein
VREPAQQRDRVVDAGHSELPLRDGSVHAALREVDDRADGVRRAVALESPVVRGADDHVQRGAHGALGQLPDAGLEGLDGVHLVHVGDSGRPLVPAAFPVGDLDGREVVAQRRAEADADFVDHLALVALGVGSPRGGVRQHAGAVGVAERFEGRRMPVH